MSQSSDILRSVFLSSFSQTFEYFYINQGTRQILKISILGVMEDLSDLYKSFLNWRKIELKPLVSFYGKQILFLIHRNLRRKPCARHGWRMKFQLKVPFKIYDPWHRLIKGHRCQHGWKAWEEKQIEKIRFFELGVFEGHLHNATGVDVAKYSTKKLAD